MKPRDTSRVSESERLGQRLVKLEETLFGAMKRISQLKEQNARLREEVARLQQQLAAARKNSSTSSKPPSSDMVKPPHKGGKKRKRGGQSGLERHLRPIVPPEAVNHFESYTLDCWPRLRRFAERFTDEHRAALDWLNESTGEGIKFFGLEIEFWKIGDLPAAPKLNVVSPPNDWTNQIGRTVREGSFTPPRNSRSNSGHRFVSMCRPTGPRSSQRRRCLRIGWASSSAEVGSDSPPSLRRGTRNPKAATGTNCGPSWSLPATTCAY